MFHGREHVRNFLTGIRITREGTILGEGERDILCYSGMTDFLLVCFTNNRVTEIHFSSKTNHFRERRDSHHGLCPSVVARTWVYLMVPAQILEHDSYIALYIRETRRRDSQ